MHEKVEDSVNIMGTDRKATFLQQTRSGEIVIIYEKNTSAMSGRGSGCGLPWHCTVTKDKKTIL